MSQTCLNSWVGFCFSGAGRSRQAWWRRWGCEDDGYTLTLLLHFDSSPVETQGTVSLRAQISSEFMLMVYLLKWHPSSVKSWRQVWWQFRQRRWWTCCLCLSPPFVFLNGSLRWKVLWALVNLLFWLLSVRQEPKLPYPINRQRHLSWSLSISVHWSARHGGLWVRWHLGLSLRCLWLRLSCPFPQIKSWHLSLTGTFGRIFHGVLLDEKDPSKEKQVFVKTVKGMRPPILAFNTQLNAQLPKKWKCCEINVL